jgi:hypothetical protein
LARAPRPKYSVLVNEVLDKWELDKGNLMAATTDAGSNMIKLVKNKSDVSWAYCMALCIDLSVDVGLAIAEIKVLVKMVKHPECWRRRRGCWV